MRSRRSPLGRFNGRSSGRSCRHAQCQEGGLGAVASSAYNRLACCRARVSGDDHVGLLRGVPHEERTKSFISQGHGDVGFRRPAGALRPNHLHLLHHPLHQVSHAIAPGIRQRSAYRPGVSPIAAIAGFSSGERLVRRTHVPRRLAFRNEGWLEGHISPHRLRRETRSCMESISGRATEGR